MEGERDGPETGWYKSGRKAVEGTHKEGKIYSGIGWKPNGDRCPISNVNKGNGVAIVYNEDGSVNRRLRYRNGKITKF